MKKLELREPKATEHKQISKVVSQATNFYIHALSTVGRQTS